MNNDLLQTMDAEESCVLKIIAVRSARQDFESSDYHFAYIKYALNFWISL